MHELRKPRFYFKLVVYILALFGLASVLVLIAMKLHLTTASSLVDTQSAFLREARRDSKLGLRNDESLLCAIGEIARIYPDNAVALLNTYRSQKNPDEIAMLINVLLHTKGAEAHPTLEKNVKGCGLHAKYGALNVYYWATTDEWAVLKDAIVKDKDTIMKAAKDADVEPRIIVAQIIAEQLRLFTSERETFKQVFLPLRTLGTQTQFSMGVTGFKDETAKLVEDHLKDSRSPYYLGQQYEHLLDYSGTPTSTERFLRFSDYRNHYYSYLYTGLYVKQVETQWKNAGYPINTTPEIISTLFNIGFIHSNPKPNPEVGGAQITIGGVDYTFGGLAGEFYYSGELGDIFPIELQ